MEELYRRRHPQRFWDPPSWDAERHGQKSQRGGYTALAVLALLYAGESYQNPRLREAIAHLEQAELEGTYAVAIRAHVWARLPPRFGDHLKRDTAWLLENFHLEAGGWSYDARPSPRWFDNSLAQYGALGLWEAAKRGVAVPPRCWQRLEQRYVAGQFPDGGWNYRGDGPVTGSMTAAGLTALFITQDLLHAREAVRLGGEASDRLPERAIARGLRWMDEHFSAAENPGRGRSHFYYYLYGVERVGLASGYAAFGGRDWFREGAAAVIDRLCERDADSGRVAVRRRLRAGRASPLHTRRLAFGLMFLSRGRVPVAVNKLRVEGLAWNNRPRDAANLTRHLAAETETALNWQIVGLDDPLRRWLEAPLLYLASHERLPWADAAGGGEPAGPLRRLKRYLDRGGLLLAVNEGRSPRFADSIEDAARLTYPAYRWRTLPREHWAYTLLWTPRGRPPPLRAMSNGVRELIILAPGSDLPAGLQVGDRKRPAVWTTLAHVYLHASEMNRPRPRLGRAPSGGAAPPSTATATVVRAAYDGNWNPEPVAIEVFASAAELRGLRVTVVERPLAGPRPQADLMMVCGVEPHEFTAAERAALRDFVETGGVVLFETPGGRGDFTRAAERSCAAIFGDAAGPVRPLLDSRIVTADGLAGGEPLGRVVWRPFTQEMFGGAAGTAPRLRGMDVDGRLAVLFSRQDISHGLLDRTCWGIAGYAPRSARALLENVIRHAAARGKGSPRRAAEGRGDGTGDGAG